MKITKVYVTIDNNDFYSTNSREYKIDLDEFSSFTSLISSMKKHTKLMKKEMLGDTTIDFLYSVDNGTTKFDLNRYIIHDGCNVKEMVYLVDSGFYDTNRDIRFDSLLKATNFIFSEIEKKLKDYLDRL